MPPVERITIFCFAASYAVAFGLELLFQFRRVPIVRVLGLGFGITGLLAHSLFVLVQPLPLNTPFGSLIFLAWVVSVFYLYGALHHRQVAWGIFVLPVVLGLTLLANLYEGGNGERIWGVFWADGVSFWGQVHGVLVLLAAVGVCVGFVASVMYLVQAQRLKDKMLPGQGIKMLSLERLEMMNRRAVTWAFPLLTVGLLIALILGFHYGESDNGGAGFAFNLKFLTVAGLWLVFAILLYLRYAAHLRGRPFAVWTIIAFGLMVISLASPVHPFVTGGAP
jgi:ABC-type transport system involved in cytochrome c biogenesis permease subunit